MKRLGVVYLVSLLGLSLLLAQSTILVRAWAASTDFGFTRDSQVAMLLPTNPKSKI